ncbi:DUF4845 domain-containing protein [Corticibacter populi]|uniref:DUF4845 domain-containing protein n=1 Tax=Corticibacter populi TaxID=1550736 RepID=A0A3M6R0G8_9BURK|nr:DUF4845 domain-containing protein [Corticibacter populi]RMX08302.1 DUF4845 domain-containing protein [Corticibacter populi]RZS35587.1 uncharacterized protein DUF4845 [Corticibacter populi]
MSSLIQPASVARQRGMSFISLVLLAVVIVFLGYVGVKTVPVVSEYMSLKRALKQAAQEGTVPQVRAAFDRVASIEYLDQYANPVRGADLEITKQNDVVVINVEYEREVPLFGPAYLVYRLNASSQ